MMVCAEHMERAAATLRGGRYFNGKRHMCTPTMLGARAGSCRDGALRLRRLRTRRRAATRSNRLLNDPRPTGRSSHTRCNVQNAVPAIAVEWHGERRRRIRRGPGPDALPHAVRARCTCPSRCRRLMVAPAGSFSGLPLSERVFRLRLCHAPLAAAELHRLRADLRNGRHTCRGLKERVLAPTARATTRSTMWSYDSKPGGTIETSVRGPGKCTTARAQCASSRSVQESRLFAEDSFQFIPVRGAPPQAAVEPVYVVHNGPCRRTILRLARAAAGTGRRCSWRSAGRRAASRRRAQRLQPCTPSSTRSAAARKQVALVDDTSDVRSPDAISASASTWCTEGRAALDAWGTSRYFTIVWVDVDRRALAGQPVLSAR